MKSTDSKSLHYRPSRVSAPGRGRRIGLLIALCVAACDVDNPGLVPDETLDEPAYLPLVVNGAAASLSDALAGGSGNAAVRMGGLLGDMFMAASSSGTTRQAKRGELPVERTDYGGPDKLHRARWIAEDAVRRAERVLGAEAMTSELYAEANIWAGYTNRLLGDTFCTSVFDGGSEGDRIEYYKRAEAAFSLAVEARRAAMADAKDTLLNAALGGRASVRIVLNDWAGAVADAQQVPDNFVFDAEFNTTKQYDRGTNELWMEMQVRRNYSIEFTWFKQYNLDHIDPRLPWYARVEKGEQSLASDNVTPLMAQDKYPEGNSPVPLTKGAEMRLIEAENLINSGDPAGAMAIIDKIRSEAGITDPTKLSWGPLPPDPVQALAQAAEFLKFERGIVLWLEARRGGDFYRWNLWGPPGAPGMPYDTKDDTILKTMNENAIAFDMSEHGDIKIEGRAICYQLSENMRETNPNLPEFAGAQLP
ncbi:MAG: RagB/SusD family nutrient uptake outer membrane protein [Proteobacteria bacterium]|nr:RagB/SusD family nutrient uptake outer membrane protein [Pseudomonadota bacterium]